MPWHARSTGHTDVHHGQLCGDGTVTAECGLSFVPEPELFGTGPRMLHPPVDPARCCSDCVAVGGGNDADALSSLVEGL